MTELTEQKDIRIKQLLKTNLSLMNRGIKLEREICELRKRLKVYHKKNPEVDRNLSRDFDCTFKN